MGASGDSEGSARATEILATVLLWLHLERPDLGISNPAPNRLGSVTDAVTSCVVTDSLDGIIGCAGVRVQVLA